MRWMYRGLPTAATVVVAAASFALSYVALRDVAIEVEAVPAYLAWLVPVVIDGGVIGASAVIWSAAAQGRRREILPFFVVATLVIISVIVNTAHAGDAVLAKVIAGLPPLVLLASLELVASQYRRDQDNEPAADPHTANKPAPIARSAPAQPAVAPAPTPAARTTVTTDPAPAATPATDAVDVDFDTDDVTDVDLSAWEDEFARDETGLISVPVNKSASTPPVNGSRRRTPRVAAIPPADS